MSSAQHSPIMITGAWMLLLRCRHTVRGAYDLARRITERELG